MRAQTAAPASGGLTFTGLEFGSPAQLPPVASVYDSASSAPEAGLVVLTSGDPGNIGSGTPDCLLWSWQIDASFDFGASSHIILEADWSAMPDAGYYFIVGVYDGTIDANRGCYVSFLANTGATGAQLMGSTPVHGASAASGVNGGSMTGVFCLDGDNNWARDCLVRSSSTSPVDYGRTSRQANPAAGAGGGLHAFCAIGSTTSRAGGSFTGLTLQYCVVPA